MVPKLLIYQKVCLLSLHAHILLFIIPMHVFNLLFYLFIIFFLFTGILNLIAEGKLLRDLSFANLRENGDFLPVSPSKLGELDPDMNDEEVEELEAAVSMTASSSAISSMDI